MARIAILDSTLCDGALAPGYSLTTNEKLRVAHELTELGVDVVEVGSTARTPDDSGAIRRVASEVTAAVVCARADLGRASIERAAEALRPSPNTRVRVATGGADGRPLGAGTLAPEAWLDRLTEMAGYAKELVGDVELVIEAAVRTDASFVRRILDVGTELGVGTVTLVDSGGLALPAEFAATLAEARNVLAGADTTTVTLGAACRNDMGLATAGVLAAVEAGAGQIACTLGGIGPGAGSASLEEVAVAIAVRGEAMGAETGIRIQRLHRTSRLLAYLTGIEPAPGRPVIGRTAFSAAESRIVPIVVGVDAPEGITPDMVGAPPLHDSEVLDDPASESLEHRYAALGYTLAPEEVARLALAYAELAGRKGAVLDEDLLSILRHGVMDDVRAHYRLGSLDVHCGATASTASVVIEQEGDQPLFASGGGDGPIAAVFDAMDGALEFRVLLDDLTVRSATPGRDALGEVSIHATIDGHSFTGRGAHTDVVRASAEAYLLAVNKAVAARVLEEEHLESESQMWGV